MDHSIMESILGSPHLWTPSSEAVYPIPQGKPFAGPRRVSQKVIWARNMGDSVDPEGPHVPTPRKQKSLVYPNRSKYLYSTYIGPKVRTF